ncbi:redoxin domain-containing protein [Bacillus cereus]|uniref:Redoxin domain-containing protein n=1 Tax=Bacillus cereus TaxID=1396 RepID=A0A9W7QKA0_BACCE|nr:redoxin domain-containing protein [Bacillus cereus]KAB2410717.1 redoxin domain-containing protein [Bacillus cereus]KAB2431854.1 redoxin domain-containing protein [Bacillus cereus]
MKEILIDSQTKNVVNCFEELDCVILRISIDSLQRHQKFIAKCNLPFLLLVDIDSTNRGLPVCCRDLTGSGIVV